MKPLSRLVPLLLALLPLARADEPLPAPEGLKFIDQGQHDRRLKGYRTPEGVKLEVVAEAPVVINPRAMTFAEDGTPFVLEWVPSPGDERREQAVQVAYKDGSKRTFTLPKKRKKDLVKALADSKGTGTYDRSAPVLQAELPAGILLHDGRLYLAGQGSVRRFKRSKPGGPYDQDEVVARGFGGFGPAGVSGLWVGPDGWLYLTAGAGDHFAEGSDGSRATVLRTGAVFRCRPDGSKLHVYAAGFRNPQGDGAFDLGGNLFHVDRDPRGCRLIHVAEAADLGWRLAPGSRDRPDPRRVSLRGERPGTVPPLLRTGRGAPAGLLIYNDTRFPEAYRGLLLCPDAEGQHVSAYKVEPDGATFKVTEGFRLLQATGDPLFRPCQVLAGPDGALYVVDHRTKPTGAAAVWGDGKNGRIYRLTWSGTKEQPALPRRRMDSWAKVAGLPDTDLLAALSREDASDRARARQELARRGDRNRAALLELLAHDERPLAARIAALGALHSMYDGAVQKGFLKALAEGEPELRKLAAEGLGWCAKKGDRAAHNALLRALSDEDPAVRRAVAQAMGRLGAGGAGENLATALSFDDVGSPGTELEFAL